MLMHCSEQRGRLILAGKPMPNLALSRLLGLSQQETQDAIEVLIDSGVASKDEAGIVLCRRMVREEEIRQNRKRAGSIGGSKRQANREANPYQTPDNDTDVGTDVAQERVRGFAKGEGIGEKDADWFFFKCEGNGWMNSGQPIRDWKAVVRTWWRAGYFPSQKQGRNGARPDFKPIDKSKIEVPERFKAWVAERYPDRREDAMKWQTWADVPINGLRSEWWKEEKSKLPIGDLI